jgi:transposase
MNFVEKLKENQVEELGLFVKSNKNKTQEIKRAQSILLLNQGLPAKTFYQLTGMKRATAVKLRKKYIKGGISCLLNKKLEKAPRTYLTKNELQEINIMLNTKTPRNYGWEWDHWTPSILGSLILQLYGVQYKSKSSIHLIFKKSKFTYHKPEKKYKNRDEKAIEKWKKDVEPEVTAALLDPNTEVIVADEMIVTSQTTLQKMWLPEGEYPIIECSNTRKRRSFYGFLNIKTGQEVAFKAEKQNSEMTVHFLKKICNQHKDKKILLIWDNAPWHKSALVKEFLSTCSNLKLINFPPYAPELNPQEHVWKAGRANATHNKFISDIDVAAREMISYLSNTIFPYEFFGFTATL